MKVNMAVEPFFLRGLFFWHILILPNMPTFCMQEIGHFLAAFPKNVKLGIPFFIPNFTLGTFGAITQVSIFLKEVKSMGVSWTVELGCACCCLLIFR
jgi:hypothetical protein